MASDVAGSAGWAPGAPGNRLDADRVAARRHEPAPVAAARRRVAPIGWSATVVLAVLGLALAFTAGAGAAAAHALAPVELETENATDPLGIDATEPLLRWKLEAPAGERGARQSAYQVRVASSAALLAAGTPDVWDSGKVISDDQAIAYGGPEPESRERFHWQVRTWDADDEPGPWSDVATWEMGLLDPSDWEAEWIGRDPPAAPVFSDFRLRIEMTPLNAAMGVFFRANGTANNFMWQLIGAGPPGAPILRKHQWVNGSVSVLGNIPIGDVIPAGEFFDRPHELVIEANGSRIDTYVDGVLVDSAEHAAHSAGTIGFRANVSDSGLGPERAVIHRVEVSEDDNTVFEDDFGVDLGQWTGSGVLTPNGLDITGTTEVFLAAPDGDAAPLLRKDFALSGPVAKARLYVTGLAYADVSLNGEPVGDHRMDPVFVDYSTRAMYVTHDVTDQVQPGANTLGAILGRGFYGMTSGSVWNWHVANWWDNPKLKLQLEVTYEGGASATFVTDTTWRTAAGPLRSDSQLAGEVYDARLEQPGWDAPGFDDSGWGAADPAADPGVPLQAQDMEPIRVSEELEPVEVTTPQPGVYVVDLGQNIAGWIEVELDGAAGDGVVMRYGEKLRANGTVDNDDVLGHVDQDYQTDRYILRGGGPETYESRFSYKGFQYVQFDGLDAPPELTSITAKHVRTDLARIGTFDSSNELFNRIEEGTRWAILNNYHGMPTDTPMFEKNGWTADGQVMIQSSMHNFDMRRAYPKWMRDMRDGQIANGRVPVIAPTHGWGNDWIAPEWSATYVILAWELYRQYGDTRVLEDHYEALKRYVDYENNRLNPTTGLSTSSLGDWAAPGYAQTSGPEGGALTATAYVWRANDLIAKIAGALDNSADEAEYASRASEIADDFNAAFLNTDSGTYNTQIEAGYRQTSNVLPLAWNLVPAGQRANVFSGLVDDVEVTRDGHLNTGVIGTKYLLRVLTREGRADLADAVANQRTYPSWGLWFDSGGTTPFEFWEVGSRSRGHMFLGTIVDWLYVDVAGLDTGGVGATRHLTVKPTLLESLDHASASTKTVFGRARSSWSRDGDAVDLEVEVPMGTTATVRLPAEDVDDVGEGGKYVRNADGVTSAAIVDGKAVIEVESGSYRFRLDEEFSEDVTPPATTHSFNPASADGAEGWYRSPVEVTLEADDGADGSGVAQTEYRLDGGSFIEYAGPFTISSDGIHALEYRSTDNEGNLEETRSAELKLDATPPTTLAALDPPTPGPDGTYDGPVTVLLTATDASAGIEATHYRVDGGAWQLYDALLPPTISAPGPHTVEYRSTDVAGNTEDPPGEMSLVLAGPGKPELKLTVKPKRKTTRAGKAAVFKAVATNGGTAAASRVKLCLKAPKAKLRLKGKRCLTRPSLTAGAKLTARFKLVPKPAARGKRLKLTFTASALGVATQRAKATLKVRR
ncbi:MAG TPA: family 78 glycoside hydrolase catalytic domain [Solirubrobacterales bacterium]|nr:family 78 glycoside hydrolase catalytic domain [Solirubrobacterales bacterium]